MRLHRLNDKDVTINCLLQTNYFEGSYLQQDI